MARSGVVTQPPTQVEHGTNDLACINIHACDDRRMHYYIHTKVAPESNEKKTGP